MAIRDRLRADQAIDFVVVSDAAVLVEEEQGDAEYIQGRSSVYFKQVERWAGRFESTWGHGTNSAPFALQRYEAQVRPMPAATWADSSVRATVDQL